MAALTKERKTAKMGQDVLPSFPTNLGIGVADNVTLWGGALICLATSGTNSGYAVPGSATAGLVALGIAERTLDNTVTGHTAGGLTVVPRQGVFLLDNSTGADAITSSNVGQDCYVVDDHTVSLSNSGATRPRAGTIVAVDSGTPGQSQPTGVWVLVGITGYTPQSSALPAYLDMSHQARVATFAALAAYTVTNGILQANANGALGTIDGVTMAVGDRVLVTLGAAGADNGIWQITSLGGASAKFTFARPSDWMSGSQGLSGTVVEVSEGTKYSNTTWKVTTTGGFTVDTTSIALYPRIMQGSTALVAGTFTIAAPILSTTQTVIALTRIVANTSTATTGGYHPTNAGANGLTAGVQGTGAAIVQACVAAGTINAADISTLAWAVIYW